MIIAPKYIITPHSAKRHLSYPLASEILFKYVIPNSSIGCYC
jgi:hypothetical protein